jgi:hypothetical protein
MTRMCTPRAAITSIATLAHHPPPTPLTASQIAFFAIAETVIPVLYLALADPK